MAFFSFFSRKPNQPKPTRRSVRLGMETLESRLTPAANTISGYVYQDVNNNGVFDSGEAPLANVALQLKSNTTNQIVATATSDANGFYQFISDNTVPTTPTSITKTLAFPDTDTNFNLTGTVDQFDPSLGVLTSIDIIHDGSITSSLLVENTSRSSGSTITGTVSGSLNLVAPGVNDTLTLSQNAGSVTVAIYDGTSDFNGPSGGNLGSKTATGSKTTTISGAALAAWQGTGKVTVQEIGTATSNASGGGNVSTAITSTGKSTITVRYNYTPTNGLQPGPYTILETQPVGYLDGKDAISNVPIADSVGKDIIVLTLSNTPLINNTFGELLASSISGYVYHDVNNNALKDASEQPIAGVNVALSGTNDLGQPVTQTTTTDGTGFYSFPNLRPGTYTVSETQPVTFGDGKETPGTVAQGVQGYIAGNTVANDQIAAIGLPAGANSVSNNFGELQDSTVSGYVYLDANNNGNKDAGEAPIANVTVTLTGFTTDGPVNRTATTDANGFYQFTAVKPGTYAITETQPANYADGKESLGSLGGTVGADTFTSVVIGSGVAGVNYNFGELVQDDADVGIVKTASVSQVRVGDTLTYTLTVTNYGQYTAKGLTVTDTLPPGAVYLGASGTGWTISQANGIITATMPSLNVNAVSTIIVQIRVPAISSSITNTTTVTTTTTDKVPGNNTSTVTTPVIIPGPEVAALQPQVLGGDASKNSYFADPELAAIRERIAQNAGVLNVMFQTILNRVPDAASYNAFSTQMYNGATAAQIAAVLWASDEHRGIQADQIYQSVLGRAPSAGERNAAVASLKANATEDTIERQLMTSAEYASLYPSNANLAGSIYLNQTGALPTQLQSQTAVQSMTNSTLDEVVKNIQKSDDALRNTVRTAYRDVLVRNAGDAEVESWLNQLKAGLSQDAFYLALYNSDEFRRLGRSTIR